MKTILKHAKSHTQWLHMKYLWPIFAISTLFLLAACGGGTTAGSSATPTATTGSSSVAATPTVAPTTTTVSDSCSLVSATQATTILGGTVLTRSHVETVGASQATACEYTSSTNAAASLAVITATDTTTAQATFSELQQISQATGGSEYQVVNGLGDSAFTNGKILYVLKGKTVMVITVANGDSTKVLPEEKQFAQAALPKVS